MFVGCIDKALWCSSIGDDVTLTCRSDKALPTRGGCRHDSGVHATTRSNQIGATARLARTTSKQQCSQETELVDDANEELSLLRAASIPIFHTFRRRHSGPREIAARAFDHIFADSHTSTTRNWTKCLRCHARSRTARPRKV